MKSGILIVLSLTVSSAAQARDLDSYVNQEMKKTEVQGVIMQDRVEAAVQPTVKIEALTNTEVNLPLNLNDQAIRNPEPITVKEQVGADLDRPQPGVPKVVDPAANYQQVNAEQQRLMHQNANLKKALEKEFVRRAAQDGVEVDRQLAHDLFNGAAQ